MISLFSSFDLFFYNFSFFRASLIPIFLSFSYWLDRFFISFKFSFSSYMSSFFTRLLSFKHKIIDSLLLSLMSLLLIVNFLSILPFFFPFTSQVSFNLFWGVSLWVSLYIFTIIHNFSYSLIHLVPEGTPFFLIWFLFLVELVRNLIRPITLVVRLLANIMAGHLLIVLLSKIVFFFPFFSFLYLFLNLVEFFVSLIQAYIFSTIICLYVSEIN